LKLRIKVNGLAKSLNVKGLLNIQFAIKDNTLYILEANPRASRTMPFVAKVTKNQIIKAGTLIMLGHTIKRYSYENRLFKCIKQ
jgi:carbamoyl-phosphate synthase large subunit